MRDPLRQRSVLVLDAFWQVSNVTTPKKALVDMAKNTATAVLVRGTGDYEPIAWEDWVKLPVSAQDEFVATARTKVLMPKVVIAVNFRAAARILKTPRLRPSEVMKVYGGVCAYTGKKVGRHGTIDHVVPRGRGGSNTWGNVVWSDQQVNNKKGNKLNREAGLPEPKIKAVKPKPVVCHVERRPDRPEWDHFLLN